MESKHAVFQMIIVPYLTKACHNSEQESTFVWFDISGAKSLSTDQNMSLELEIVLLSDRPVPDDTVCRYR